MAKDTVSRDVFGVVSQHSYPRVTDGCIFPHYGFYLASVSGEVHVQRRINSQTNGGGKI